MTPVFEQYEYAGFLYAISTDSLGYRADPLPGQHPAAGKTKHRMNAVSCFKEDYYERTDKAS